MKESVSQGRSRTGKRPEGGGRPVVPLSLALLIPTLALALMAPARAEEPLWGEIASTLGKGFVNVTTRGSYEDTKPFRHHGGAVLLTTARMDVAAGVEVGLQPNLDLHLRVPFVMESYEERFAGQTAKHDISGMGEMLVGSKWRFWQAMDDRHKDELALLTDVKLPSGANDLRDAHGAIVPAHLQPNSGNLGFMIGLAANRHTPWGGFWLSSMYSAEVASSRYRRGNLLEMHASTGRRLWRLARPEQTDWMGIAGLHFHQMGKEQEGGRTLPDSGGSVVSAEVGLVGSKGPRGLRLGMLFPLHTDLGLAHAPPRREIQASFRASF